MPRRAAGASYNWPPQTRKVTKATDVDIVDKVDTEWRRQANCLGVDPELFYPDRGVSTREPKAVCKGCVVQEKCLEYALVNGEKFGIWGGLSERERRRIRRQRTLARRTTA